MSVKRAPVGSLGVVYTPASVARPMVELALRPLVAGKTADEILALRVCDPALGEGAFLRETVHVLAEHLVAAWTRDGTTEGARSFGPSRSLDDARRLVATTCIAGVEIDEQALAKARFAIATAVGDPTLVAELSALRLGDALAIDWRATFGLMDGFDAVLANPPYIRQEQLSGKPNLESYDTYDGVADLYVYFIELAHRIMRSGGRYCVIVPNKWQTAAYGRKLREFLVDAASVEGLIDLSTHQLFRGADAFPCILFGTKDGRASEQVLALRATPEMSVEMALAAITAPDATVYQQPRERWTAEPWHIEPFEVGELLSRIERSYPRLGDIIGTRWSRGVVTGFNEAFVLDAATRDQLLAEEPAAATVIRPFVKGRDLCAYSAPDVERWILLIDRGTSLEALPRVRTHLAAYRSQLEPKPERWSGNSKWPGRKPGPYAWFELQDPVVPLAKNREPRILYQDIQTVALASLDRSGEIVPDTTVWILPSTDLVILAILNSPLYGWIARRRFMPALNGAVRPKLSYMQRLPIPRASPALRAQLERLVEQRVADGDTVHDAPIAELVAQLYELTPSERALITSTAAASR